MGASGCCLHRAKVSTFHVPNRLVCLALESLSEQELGDVGFAVRHRGWDLMQLADNAILARDSVMSLMLGTRWDHVLACLEERLLHVGIL